MTVRVVVEVADRRAFASALEWPGWSRAGKTPDEAMERLVAYASRYADVATLAGLELERPESAAALEVVERLAGNATTNFGAPSAIAPEERHDDAVDLGRLLALLRASWQTFDAAVNRAEGRTLATGPRGGGRTAAKMVEHVRDAEAAYLSQLGSRPPPYRDDEPSAGMRRVRTAFVEALTAVVAGDPIPNPRATRKPWPPRYAVRRAAWHVLDHAWELEDRLGG